MLKLLTGLDRCYLTHVHLNSYPTVGSFLRFKLTQIPIQISQLQYYKCLGHSYNRAFLLLLLLDLLVS